MEYIVSKKWKKGQKNLSRIVLNSYSSNNNKVGQVKEFQKESNKDFREYCKKKRELIVLLINREVTLLQLLAEGRTWRSACSHSVPPPPYQLPFSTNIVILSKENIFLQPNRISNRPDIQQSAWILRWCWIMEILSDTDNDILIRKRNVVILFQKNAKERGAVLAVNNVTLL